MYSGFACADGLVAKVYCAVLQGLMLRQGSGEVMEPNFHALHVHTRLPISEQVVERRASSLRDVHKLYRRPLGRPGSLGGTAGAVECQLNISTGLHC